MKILQEFKSFAMKGNILDLAVAVILGGAFGTIVFSMVEDVITPLLLAPALDAIHATDLDKLVWKSVKYGKFIAAIIKFLFTAAILFIIIQSINRVSKKEAAKPVATPEEITLLREIRDSLKNRS